MRAAAAAVRSRAAEPLVHAAYAILSADATPAWSDTTLASSGVFANKSATARASAPDRYRRDDPAELGGGPINPPSTKDAPAASAMAPISRDVAGATALASTYNPRNPLAAIVLATSSANSGGHTDKISSD